MVTVTGSRRAFGATSATTAPDAVWRLWTDPSSWADWDRGLTSASLEGPFSPGAQGRLVDTGGRTSPFVVEEVDAGRRCRVRVRLPGAALVLERSLQPSDAGSGATSLRHDVRFDGLLGPVFALLLARRFRELLPRTLDALVRLAEGPARS